VIVGDYVVDLVGEDKAIVELKAVSRIEKVHEVQLVHYLRATGIEVGLLINFGNSVEVRRKIMDRYFRARAGAPGATPSSSSDPCESA
jgi:GxxExxY protein